MSAPKSAVTPMMAQFLEIKQDYPDALLFYRMGDFYEMFFDDAVLAAEALDIALTKRGKHLGEDIPMCGVPHHAAEGYFLTLIRKGFRVAVCEQLESPAEAKKRGSKSVVKRGVVRLVTPGTLTEDSLLNARHHNYLMAAAHVRDLFSVAWVDISTGDFQVQTTTPSALGPLIARLAPKELLLTEKSMELYTDTAEEMGCSVTHLGNSSFDSTSAERRLQSHFGVKSLDSFGSFDRANLSSMGAILDYLDLTQKGKLPLLKPPQIEAPRATMQIDAATRRNLELTHALSGGREGTLLRTIDRTCTNGGARLLERRLTSPSTDKETVLHRLDAVHHFTEKPQHRSAIRSALKQVPDIDRALSRLSIGRGGPRDIGAIRAGLGQAADIAALFKAEPAPQLLAEAAADLVGHDALQSLLENALIAEPPLLSRDGGFVATGFNAALDEARNLRDQGRQVISGLQSDYTAQTGITALKVKHNNVLGYFIETPSTHADKMLSEPLSETFIHRQTTANAVRFTTVELSEMETKILNAGGEALELEKRIFDELVAEISDKAAEIAQTARALSEIDLASSLADLAVAENYVRPDITNTRAFAIEGGRHPVVEAALKKDASASFIANDCDISAGDADKKSLWLLTGPNMAGKSTFLRQNALIAILAQMGSFVPASQAEIGIVSQLFSRVGASDDLARGRSTFMVEMVETAAILNQADEGALVILDEIGRGTATYDGLSIAWATLEHLHDVNQCRTLFATHYHELTGLTAKLSKLKNVTVKVREWENEIVFLHEVAAGAADKSYGVQVAKLAGLPPAVIARAKDVLAGLESGGAKDKTASLMDDLPLFSATPPPATVVENSPALERLEDIHPDELSPKEALALLYDLKDMLKG